jgi:hypothetical protein
VLLSALPDFPTAPAEKFGDHLTTLHGHHTPTNLYPPVQVRLFQSSSGRLNGTSLGFHGTIH